MEKLIRLAFINLPCQPSPAALGLMANNELTTYVGSRAMDHCLQIAVVCSENSAKVRSLLDY